MQQMYSCPNCKNQVEFGMKFCTNCGIPLTWQEQTSPPIPTPEEQPEQGQIKQTATKTRKQSSASAIIFTLLLVIAVLAAAGILAYGVVSPIPIISNVYSSSITDSSAVITWVTDIPSSSQAEYGVSKQYGSNSAINQSQVTAHSITLYGLLPNTTYHCRVKSKGQNWSEAVSSDITFTTAALKTQ